MTDRGGYTFVGGRTAIEAEPGRVRDHTGAEWRADVTILCPGAAHTGVAAPWLADAPLRRCRLQMMQTEPLGERLTTSIADGDSLRYYPAFAVPEAAGAARTRRRSRPRGGRSCSIAQRAGGELTIGDTHVYDEPYDFAVEERALRRTCCDRAESILGRPLPPVQRRWAGVYSQATDASACVRVAPEPGLVVVTGPGGRGMTLSPAIAAETFEGAGLVIRLAVLDMAGTTVRDGGVVERSFVEALGGMGFDPDGAELRDAPRLRARDDGPVEDRRLPRRVRRRRGARAGGEPALRGRVRRARSSRGEIEPLPGAETALARAAGARRADLPHDRLLGRRRASS